jgi:hypothetical protein
VETKTITIEEYNRLVNAKLHLDLLIARGVDNWQGYCSLPDREDYETEAEWLKAIDNASMNG